jgi:hypothetical protein
MSYLITCAGSKIEPIEFRPSNYGNLSFEELSAERAVILSKSGIVLNWDLCLPAYILYSGKHSQIYSQIDELSFLNLNTDIMILSALFGWIRPLDLIPHYNLRMSDKIDGGKKVWQIWKDLNILHKFIKTEDRNTGGGWWLLMAESQGHLAGMDIKP